MAGVIKYKAMTLLGQRVLRREIRAAGAGASGVREILLHWQDAAIGQPTEWPAGTTTSRIITGNERRGTLQILVAEHVVDLTEFYKD